jgi:hypothetical protein
MFTFYKILVHINGSHGSITTYRHRRIRLPKYFNWIFTCLYQINISLVFTADCFLQNTSDGLKHLASDIAVAIHMPADRFYHTMDQEDQQPSTLQLHLLRTMHWKHGYGLYSLTRLRQSTHSLTHSGSSARSLVDRCDVVFWGRSQSVYLQEATSVANENIKANRLPLDPSRRSLWSKEIVVRCGPPAPSESRITRGMKSQSDCHAEVHARELECTCTSRQNMHAPAA